VKVTEGLYAFLWNSPVENNCNAFLVRGGKNVLIDPGHRHLFRHVEEGLRRLGTDVSSVDLVIVTHGHPDHIEGLRMFRKPTLLAMGEEEYRFLLERGGGGATEFAPDIFLREGELTVGDLSFEVLLTPGHSPGSISLYWKDRKALFTGDVVFSKGIGRTDLPGGAGRKLRESIERLKGLDVEFLLPGHGETVRGREAVRRNFQFIEGYWYPHLR